MSWLGKIIGGTIGFFLGGPLGLIAGAVFGHMIDRGSDYEKSGGESSDAGYSGRHFFSNTGYSRSQMVFFVGAFSMLAKLASSDGPVTDAERSKIEEFMVNDLNLSGRSLQYARSVFNQALVQDASFENLAEQFYSNFRSSPQILNLMIDIFYRVAMVDGTVSAAESRLIDYAVRVFRISDSIHESIRQNHRVRGASKAYALLGLTENATEAEIKKAYRKKILEYHPDTVAAKGMADEFKEYATKRFREVQEAYETICRERGIK
ncbi:MAG: DnaJ domain-containing protein [Sphaerochaeta sp.]